MASPANKLVPSAPPANQALDVLVDRLERIEEAGLFRSLRPIGPANTPRITIEGRDCLLMASNDYLGLNRHPRLAEAALESVLTHGTGTGASRLISGTLDAHAALEEDIARFKHAEAALFMSTGYMTNLSVITGLAGPGDLIVSDELNHASIIDACRLSRAEVKVYPHRDAAAAARLLQENPARLKLLVTDGVFSMDGDLAPLPELLAVAQDAGALLVVDDAHGTGVWGKTGRGTVEHFGITPPEDLAMVGTFSKALGGQGGFCAASDLVIRALVNRARPFLYSTAPPPAQIAAARAALRLVDDEPELRERLRNLCARLRSGIDGLGLKVVSSQGPIVPVLVGDAWRALALAKALLDRGVYVPAIRPPTVREGTCRLRFTVTAAHKPGDIDQAVEALAAAIEETGL
jgi:8-amino-7-oxononanoate synthase